MSTNAELVTLPGKEEMLRRLIEVSDNAHAIQKLYPLILDGASSELTPSGVVLMFHLAIAEYAEGSPQVIFQQQMMLLPQYVSALIDDEAAKTKAQAFIEELNTLMNQARDN